MTLTSVISMMSAPPLVRTTSVGPDPQRPSPSPAILIQGERPATEGPEATFDQGRMRLAGSLGLVEQTEERRAAPREKSQGRPLSIQDTPDAPDLFGQFRSLLERRQLELVGEYRVGVPLPLQVPRYKAKDSKIGRAHV